ncbi:hypothetical protein FFLO_06099 [Filobasidium floriforme]|uniref:Glutathione peroxidase n=1 Tax=Filobasidium floriforme TaxID=5210 RepID=A0A8K0JG07_9TREE|nr:thioredoxin-like protein [Filobasidium floriforme]KAG7528508.1 hypothetical protein FFLO_06099 [Filobasidium floriforme]KAH8085919.1 thioredoxin-like protein [Filobasidium floriforme]
MSIPLLRTRLHIFRNLSIAPARPRITLLACPSRSFFSTTPTIMSSSSTEPQPQTQPQGWIWNKLGYEDLPASLASQKFYDLEADLPGSGSGGKVLKMEECRGKVVLIVNTASQCGFTPQYTALQALHTEYKDQGLVVIGFPCDQFGGQEPGSDEDIASFCQLNHGVDFKLVKKSEVNGPKQNSVFAWLKQQEHGKGLMGTSVVKCEPHRRSRRAISPQLMTIDRPLSPLVTERRICKRPFSPYHREL